MTVTASTLAGAARAGRATPRVRRAASLVQTISGAYEELADLIGPSVEAREFTAMLPSLIDLEKTQGSKTAVDDAVAHLAGLHHAGDLTGTRRVDLFLAEIFDLTRREARARGRGHRGWRST